MTTGGFPHSEILGSKPCWRLPEAYRSLKRPSSVLSAKHPPYALASNPHDPSGNGGKPQAHGKNSAGNTNHHTNDHTQNDQTPDSEESGEINSRRHPQKGVPCSRPLSSSQTTTHPHASPPTPPGTGDRHGARNTSHAKRRGVAVREPKSMPAPLLDAPHDRHARRPTPLFHTSNPHTPGTSGARGHTPATRQWPEISVERR